MGKLNFGHFWHFQFWVSEIRSKIRFWNWVKVIGHYRVNIGLKWSSQDIVRTLSGHCQDIVRTLSGHCQDIVSTCQDIIRMCQNVIRTCQDMLGHVITLSGHVRTLSGHVRIQFLAFFQVGNFDFWKNGYFEQNQFLDFLATLKSWKLSKSHRSLSGTR